MKTVKFLCATLIVATLIFTSCQKDNNLVSETQDFETQDFETQDFETQATSTIDDNDISSEELNSNYSRSSYQRIRTVYSRKVPFGNGTVRTFVKLGRHNYTEEVGIAFSESALRNLPHEFITAFEIPQVGSRTHLKHVLLDFTQGGHEPQGIYTVPHFDLHFYAISNAERESIVANDPRFAVNPPAGFLPPVYIQAGPVPKMGMHWADPTSAEFQGQPFTSTFIYGSLADKVTFYEPMITLDYLKRTSSKYFPIKQPTKFGKTGFYATRYGLRHNRWERQYEVVLTDFKKQWVCN